MESKIRDVCRRFERKLKSFHQLYHKEISFEEFRETTKVRPFFVPDLSAPITILSQPAPVVIHDHSIRIDNSQRVQNIQVAEKKEEKKEEEEDQLAKYVLIITGIVVALGGTYLLSIDDYMKIYFLDLEKELNLIVEYSQGTEYEGESLKLKNRYRNWIDQLVERTRPLWYGKLGLVGSTLGGICGYLAFASMIPVYGTAVGISLAGGYYIYKKVQQRYQVEEESDQYQAMMEQLEKFQQILLPKPPLYPTLPDPYTTQPFTYYPDYVFAPTAPQ